jgi:hypothetical protein
VLAYLVDIGAANDLFNLFWGKYDLLLFKNAAHEETAFPSGSPFGGQKICARSDFAGASTWSMTACNTQGIG